MSCRPFLPEPQFTVIGPVLEDEAAVIHQTFWSRSSSWSTRFFPHNKKQGNSCLNQHRSLLAKDFQEMNARIFEFWLLRQGRISANNSRNNQPDDSCIVPSGATDLFSSFSSICTYRRADPTMFRVHRTWSSKNRVVFFDGYRQGPLAQLVRAPC